MKPSARLELESPHRREHDASRERLMSHGLRPRGIGQYINWLLTEWAREMPDRIHAGGVWRSRPGNGETIASGLQGGSALGAPAWADPFRRYIENRPGETDQDGFYVRPIHAALSEMAGRNPHSNEWYWARFLVALASSGGDWQGVAYRSGIPPQLAQITIESLLYRLWSRWREGPDKGIASVA